jgi:hypothetical protein
MLSTIARSAISQARVAKPSSPVFQIAVRPMAGQAESTTSAVSLAPELVGMLDGYIFRCDNPNITLLLAHFFALFYFFRFFLVGSLGWCRKSRFSLVGSSACKGQCRIHCF